MRHFILLWMLFISLNCFCQTTKTEYDYYENGQVHWKGKQQLKDDSYSPIGLWQYWHENGKLKLETWNDESSKTKYLNMWLPTGEQILNNGQGTIYEVWPQGYQMVDSTIFEIKDSVKQGSSKVFRVYNGSIYFFVMAGKYDEKSKKTGKWMFRDTVIGNAFECIYLNGKKNGLYKTLYLNGVIRDSGQYKNDYKDGEWKYYDSTGILIKECSYVAGKLIGAYKEFYSSGVIRISGTYRQAEGLIKVSSRSLSSGKRRVNNKKIDNKEYKSGQWIYYDINGEILRKESFE